MPALARVWQMLLKGLGEVQAAPSPIQAAEMVLVRLAYVADLPAPAELVRAPCERAGGGARSGPAAPVACRQRPRRAPRRSRRRGGARPVANALAGAGRSALPARDRSTPSLAADRAPAVAARDPMPQSFAEVVALFEKHREAVLRAHLVSHCPSRPFRAGADRAAASRRARRATSPTGSASCSSNGPARAG